MKKELRLTVTLTVLFTVILFGLLYLTYKSNSSAVTASANPVSQKTVIIDAGHGGEDGGAVAPDGTNEKDINLDISLKLEKFLKLYGFKVIMVRTDDCLIYSSDSVTMRKKKVSDIRNRMKIIEDNPEALFVSVHQNKYDSPSVHGAQVFYSKNNPESKVLAQFLQDSFTLNLQPQNKRKVKPTGTEIYLLYHAQSVAVMAECGFVSNYEELSLLKQDKYRLKIAMTLADGIVRYCYRE